jgi:glucose uptake protein GlcU
LVLNIPFSFLSAIVLTPIILMVSSVPLTVNGLGVWEWAFSFYMAQAGAPLDQGLAVALALRAKSLLVSLIGGILFLAERSPVKAQAEQPVKDA